MGSCIGRHKLAAAVNDAHFEADLGSERVRASLQVAKKRGKKLGTHNMKVKGKSAKAQKKKAKATARALKDKVNKLMKQGHGRKYVMEELNADVQARAVHGKAFTMPTTQRLMNRVRAL